MEDNRAEVHKKCASICAENRGRREFNFASERPGGRRLPLQCGEDAVVVRGTDTILRGEDDAAFEDTVPREIPAEDEVDSGGITLMVGAQPIKGFCRSLCLPKVWIPKRIPCYALIVWILESITVHPIAAGEEGIKFAAFNGGVEIPEEEGRNTRG